MSEALKGAVEWRDARIAHLEQQVRAAEAQAAQLRAELAEWQKLKDPNVVHVALLRKQIGVPTVEQLVHVHGLQALANYRAGVAAIDAVREG